VEEFDQWFQGMYKDAELTPDELGVARTRAAVAAAYLELHLGHWAKAHLEIELARQVLHLDYLDDPYYAEWLENLIEHQDIARRQNLPEAEYLLYGSQTVGNLRSRHGVKLMQSRNRLNERIADLKGRLFSNPRPLVLPEGFEF
jgi:hypothetical protein